MTPQQTERIAKARRRARWATASWAVSYLLGVGVVVWSIAANPVGDAWFVSYAGAALGTLALNVTGIVQAVSSLVTSRGIREARRGLAVVSLIACVLGLVGSAALLLAAAASGIHAH